MLKVTDVAGEYCRIKLSLTTSKGNRFFAEITAEGIAFMSDESSSGALYGTPILKTADDLLDWIGDEGPRKPFRKRKQVQAKGHL